VTGRCPLLCKERANASAALLCKKTPSIQALGTRLRQTISTPLFHVSFWMKNLKQMKHLKHRFQ
jgi:hypothetical protein